MATRGMPGNRQRDPAECESDRIRNREAATRGGKRGDAADESNEQPNSIISGGRQSTLELEWAPGLDWGNLSG